MINLSIQSDRDKLEKQIETEIDAFCSEHYYDGHRKHLGASIMGEPCSRKLFYMFRWVKDIKYEGRIQRIFNVGNEAEARFIKYLKGIGFEFIEPTNILHYHPESNSYWYSGEFNNDDGLVEDVTGIEYHEKEAKSSGVDKKQHRISGVNGHYGGSLDGKCIPPKRYGISEPLVFLNEFKTNNTGAGFTAIEKDGVAKAKPKHYAQMCQYGFKEKLKYGLYLIENKNDSIIIVKIVELDWIYGASLERKAEEIIYSQEPPNRISDNPAYFDCKYCEYLSICHEGKSVEKNCRSCKFAVPIENAQWGCKKYNQIIPEDFIKLGCDQHESINK